MFNDKHTHTKKKTAEMKQTSILDRLVHKWNHGLLTKGTRLSADNTQNIGQYDSSLVRTY